MVELSVTARNVADSSEALRAQGLIPAVFYGPKQASTPVSIDERKLEKVWKEAGETTIVKLSGVGEDMDALFHDVQLHPVTGRMLHADFYVLEKGKKVRISVPLEFDGQAPAEKLGHIIVKAMHELEIEVAPAELPHHLIVDLAMLTDVGTHILASDVKLPVSAELITDAEEIVASVTEFVEEDLNAPVAPVTEAAPVNPPADDKKEE
jgi:large subunit ribosomal protein L25